MWPFFKSIYDNSYDARKNEVDKFKKLPGLSISIFILLEPRFDTIPFKRFNKRGASRSRLIARTRRFDFDRILFAISTNYIYL